MVCKIFRSKDLRIDEAILLWSYLHKPFSIKKVLNNSWAHLQSKSDFLKHKVIV